MRGFTVIEVLLALTLVIIAVLTLLGLTTVSLRAHDESDDLVTASALCDRLMEESIGSANRNQPPGKRADFWDKEWTVTPFETGQVKLGTLEYNYEIYAQTLTDLTTGTALGTQTGVTDNRVKKVDIHVWWMVSDRTEQRQGYGALRTHQSCLVNEPSNP